MKRLAFLECSDIGVRYSGLAARALGFEPLFLCTLRDFHADPLAQLREFEHVECDTSDLQAVLVELRRHDVAAVTSLADARLRVATAAAIALGVPGLDPAVVRLKDKGAVQALVPEFSPASVTFPLSAIPYDRIHALFRQSSKVIVKPADAAGALGVMELGGEAELKHFTDWIRLQNLPHDIQCGGWIAQEFMNGNLVSVEGFVAAGVCRVLGFSLRKKVKSTESASTFPADNQLSSAARTRATLGVETLIGRSGFRNGYFHVEFIVQGDQCTMIDANVGRVGGGAVAEQLALAYGLRPLDVYRHVFLSTLIPERVDDPYQARTRRETYAILYGLKNGGRVRSLEVPKELQAFHTRLVSPGCELAPMGKNDWVWAGILSGYTADVLSAINRIRIHTDEGSFEPYY